MKAPKSYEEGMERLNAILAKMQDEQKPSSCMRRQHL